MAQALVAPQITSASSVISLFKEPELQIKAFALHSLLPIVDTFWPEVANHLEEIEALFENQDFQERTLAAFIASKVYYHLEEYTEALRLALESEQWFDVAKRELYVDTIVAKSIDQYIAQRKQQQRFQEKEQRPEEEAMELENIQINPKLEKLIEKMFQNCFEEKKFKQAIGVALESRRLDMITLCIVQAGSPRELILYTQQLTLDKVEDLEFRRQVVQELVTQQDIKKSLSLTDICKMHFYLKNSNTVAEMLQSMVQENQLMNALQVSFDLYETEDQFFLIQVIEKLPQNDIMINKIKTILSGETPSQLYLHFWKQRSQADQLVIDTVKQSIDIKNSITHSATIISNGFHNCATSNDQFLHNNLDWVAKATNWARFSATASLGVIHKGNHKQAMDILQPYFQVGGQNHNPYQESGSLFALGLIFANSGKQEIVQFLLDHLRTQNPQHADIIQHGSALGLGLVAMGSGNPQLFDELKNILFADSAVAGESAGYAMGLIMLGSNDERSIQDMITYAHETRHEKIIRALSIGLALIVYNKGNQAEALITQLINEKDALLRYGGMYAMALAYVGSGHKPTIQRLLHHACNDTDYDVRRAAVTGIGFLLIRDPLRVPDLVQLLAKSYNPFARCGAAMAIGVACMGMPNCHQAIKILQPMLNDQTNFVRQAAYIANSLVMVQNNSDQANKFREQCRKTAGEKRGEDMTKFGAILASGIIDIAGGNSTLNIISRQNTLRSCGVVGITMFLQFWYWYPLLNFVSMVIKPTALIGLTSDLSIPKEFTFISNAKPALFAYPPKMVPPENAKQKKIQTAVLSTTKKAQVRAAAKKKETGDEMEIEQPEKPEEQKQEPEKPEQLQHQKEEAQNHCIQENASKVLPRQEQFIQYNLEQRFTPFESDRKAGIILLNDSNQGEQYQSFMVDWQTDFNLAKTEDEDLKCPPEFIYDDEMQKAAFR